jgi:hypothetical protein
MRVEQEGRQPSYTVPFHRAAVKPISEAKGVTSQDDGAQVGERWNGDNKDEKLTCGQKTNTGIGNARESVHSVGAANIANG